MRNRERDVEDCCEGQIQRVMAVLIPISVQQREIEFEKNTGHSAWTHNQCTSIFLFRSVL